MAFREIASECARIAESSGGVPRPRGSSLGKLNRRSKAGLKPRFDLLLPSGNGRKRRAKLSRVESQPLSLRIPLAL